MILYEETDAIVRFGEHDLAGRRVAARAFPYSREVGPHQFRFDPIERQFLRRETQGRVLVGPHDPVAWRRELARGPAGPALIGPSDPAEEIRGAYLAAAEGAREAGRGAFLLDPEPSGLPAAPEKAFVAVFCWQPQATPVGAIAEATERGIPSGLLFPVVPGWTGEPEFLAELLVLVSAAGLAFLSPVAPVSAGNARRNIVEARGEAEGFFEAIHHLDWANALPASLHAARETIVSRGLAVLPPRPVGAGQPRGNAAVAARLEEKADAAARDEHRSALLYAAARWIDESGRDLKAVFSEGNFRKVFPFGPEIASEAEEALREAGR